MTVLCVSWFCSPAVTDVRFTHGECDVVCHDLFREERLFIALGYGVVFVAHRKISFVYVFRVRWNVTRPFSPCSAEADKHTCKESKYRAMLLCMNVES